MSDLLQFTLSQQDQFKRARLPSLFSDFSTQRHANPDGYLANVNTWRDVLCKATAAGLISGHDGTTRRFSFETGPHLLQELESKEWGRPLALDAVVEGAGKVLAHLQRRNSQLDRLLPMTMFNKDAAIALGFANELDDQDLEILLKYLARDRQALVYDDHVVKIFGLNESFTPISKEDQTIASLKSLIENLKEQIRKLETRIATSSRKSQDAVMLKNRPSALAALRSKRLAESVLSQRTDTLSQLEQVYESIKQASNQITMLQVMKDSARVLRDLNARVGNVDNVEEALHNLKEEMGKVEDIGSAISEAGQGTSATDEDELDEELDALLRHQESEEEEKAAERTKQKLASIQEVSSIDRDSANQSMLSNDEENTAFTAPFEPAISKETRALRHLSLDEEGESALTSHSDDRNDNVVLET
ncbi:MAG: hypothetical protein Q9201_001699 [Fulgogasparrea decipioides]